MWLIIFGILMLIYKAGYDLFIAKIPVLAQIIGLLPFIKAGILYPLGVFMLIYGFSKNLVMAGIVALIVAGLVLISGMQLM